MRRNCAVTRVTLGRDTHVGLAGYGTQRVSSRTLLKRKGQNRNAALPLEWTVISTRAYLPEPTSLTSATNALPLRAIESLPVTFPCCVGVKVTLIVQLAPGATEVPQLLVWV